MKSAYRNDSESRETNQTFPNTSPKDVAIVHVKHDPLAVERVFVYWTFGSMKSALSLAIKMRINSHIPSRVVAGNVATLGNVVVRAGIWSETGSTRGRLCVRRRYWILHFELEGCLDGRKRGIGTDHEH